MVNILVVEDEENISNMLCDLLKQNAYIPTAAYSGTEAVMRFKSETYALVLLDLMIPGKSGIEVLSEIRMTSSVPVIALTAVGDKESIVSLLKAGANDYITKPFDNEELLARIEVQLRNATSIPPSHASTLTFRDLTLDLEQYDAFIDNQPLHLSKREFDILKLLMQYPKKVFTKNNLYESVWKDEFLGDDNTINVHISKLRSKIAKARPDDEYIQTVWGIGFKLKE